MTIKVPTLTTDGFVDDIGLMSDRLLSYFLVSEYSQSNLYYGKISSLTYLVYKHGNDPDQMNIEIQKTLQGYLERHFDSVTIKVNITNDAENPDSGQYGIRLDINVTKGGEKYSMGKEVSVINSKLVSIMDTLNNG